MRRTLGVILGQICISLLMAGAAIAQPSFSKVFAPNTIGPGSTTRLVFTIANGAGIPVTDLAFTDALPAAVTLATPAVAETDCIGATLTAPDGGGTITLSDGAVAGGSSCTVTVLVTSSTPGTHTNTSGDLTSNTGNSGTATDDLMVMTDRPGFSKSFSPTTVGLGGRSTLTFTFDNTANANQAFSLTFSDSLPTGLVVADPAAASTTCSGGVITATPGSSTVAYGPAFAGDATVIAGASCTVSVDVLAQAATTFDNISGELTSSSPFFLASGFATASLEATAGAVVLIKDFTDDPVLPGGTVTLEFTLLNRDRFNAVTGLAFTDDLDATLTGLVATGLPAANVCGAGSSLSGTSLLSFAGGSLPAEGSCTFSVTLQVPVGVPTGVYPNVTSTVTGMAGGSPVVGDPAAESLFVDVAPSLTKTFLTDPVGGGGTTTVEFTITNNSTTSAATDIDFSDNLDAFISGAAPSALPAAGFCGAGSFAFTAPVGGEQVFTVTGANLAAGASCTFTIDLTVPAGTPSGTYVNTTGPITGTIDGTERVGLAASDTLAVVAAPSLSKAFTDDPVQPGDTVTLEFTLEHSDQAPADATAITFTDDLAATLTGLAATGLPQNDICGTGSSLSGTTNLTFAGGTLAPGASCTFSVTLQVPAGALPGSYTNTTSMVMATVGGVATLQSGGVDDLDISGLMFSKSFTDDPVLPGGTVTLEFTIDNSSTLDATGMFFTDSLSTTLSGLVATGLPQNDICGVGSQISGTSFLIFTGGNLTAGTFCTFSVTLQVPAGAASGDYGNVTSSLTATVGGSTIAIDPATDALTVNNDVLMLSKSFTDDPVPPGGTVTLEFTVDNLETTQAITGITFTDDLDAALSGLVATGLPAMNVCGAGSTLSGTSLLTLTGGNLSAGGSCTFSVTLMVPAGVPLGSAVTNITSTVTGSIGGIAVDGVPATDDLAINFLSFEKSFDGPTVATGTPTLTVTIMNLSTSSTVSDLSFSDDLGAVIPGLIATGLPLNDACGMGSVLSGTSFLTFTGGSLLPMGSCSLVVPLLVPGTATAGSFLNTTSDLFQSGLSAAVPATATLVVEPPPAFSKAFSPNSVGFGQQSTLTLTIDNSASALGANNLDFTDNLPAGVQVAAVPNASTTCTGGTLTATPGSSAVSYTGGSVAAGASCQVQVDVATSANGALVNTTGSLTSSSGNSGTASAVLTVNPQPGFSKSFAPDPILVGGVSTLTFTIDNSASTAAATALDFTDNLPAGMTVATPGNASTTCSGGTLTAADGSSTITYTGGTVSAGATCTVTVDVTSSTAGTSTNTSGALTSVLGGSGTATDTLTINPPPTFAKAFAPATITAGGVSTLTFTIDNSASTVAATALDFTDTLPAGMVVATPGNAANTCGGTLTAVDGSASVALTGGTVGAGTTCTVSVDVTSNIQGANVNTSGDLTSSSGNSGPASDTLTVNFATLGFSKSFASDPILIGDTIVLTLTIDNSANGSPVGNLDFTDTLPAGLVIGTPSNAATSCTGGTLTAVDGSGSVSYTGGTVAALSMCTVTVDVTATSAGVKVNLTGDLTSDAGNAGTATDTVTVNPPPTFAKAFAPATITAGGVSTLTLTIDNSASTVAATGLDFTDSLPAGMTVATPGNASTTCTGGTLTAVDGSSTVSYTSGSVGAGASCVVMVDVTSTIQGASVNTSGDLTSSSGNSGPAMATLTVDFAQLVFAKTFTPDTVMVDDPSVLELTIDNSANGSAVGNLDFTDSLPAGLVVATPANASTDCTGGTVTAATGSSSVSYTGGTVAAGATCSVTVDVTSDTQGVYVNTTGDLTSDAGNAGTASATLTVVGELGFTKQFVVNPVLPGGMVNLEYTITNPSPDTGVTDLTFTDDLDTVIPGLVAVGFSGGDPCGTGSTFSGTSLLTLSGGNLPVGGSCTFTAQLAVPAATAAGTYPSLSSRLTGMAGSAMLDVAGAADDLVVELLGFTKMFDEATVLAGGTSTLTFQISNPDPVNSATDLAFTDDLDAVISGLEAIDLPQNDICGVGSSLTGTSLVTFTGGSLGPLEMCTFTLTYRVPPSASSGVVTNQTSPLDASVGGQPVAGGPDSTATSEIEIVALVLEIPTLGGWGLILMALGLALWAVRRISIG